jgi:ketosteroid isomerase-like protein
MTEIPDVIGRYVAATNARDVEAMTACFAPDATVRDEGRRYAGRAEIRAWEAEVTEKYGLSSELLETERDGDALRASMRVSGTFPSSPAVLHYHFRIKEGLITQLEIG